LQGNDLTCNYFKVPMVVHSALEIAAVGLTEDEADQAGFEPDVARTPMTGSGKARAHHEHEGFIEVVHDAETGQLLGGCIVGPEAGEQIHMMSAACQSTRGLWFFKDMSYSHPSWCEELETTVDPYTHFYRSGKPVSSAASRPATSAGGKRPATPPRRRRRRGEMNQNAVGIFFAKEGLAGSLTPTPSR
jgi:dihydrolipoamide dehydrogenase